MGLSICGCSLPLAYAAFYIDHNHFGTSSLILCTCNQTCDCRVSNSPMSLQQFSLGGFGSHCGSCTTRTGTSLSLFDNPFQSKRSNLLIRFSSTKSNHSQPHTSNRIAFRELFPPRSFTIQSLPKYPLYLALPHYCSPNSYAQSTS